MFIVCNGLPGNLAHLEKAWKNPTCEVNTCTPESLGLSQLLSLQDLSVVWLWESQPFYIQCIVEKWNTSTWKKSWNSPRFSVKNKIDFLGFGKQGSLGSIAPELLAVTDQMVNLVIALKNQVTQLIQLVANQVEMMASPLDFGETKKNSAGSFGRCLCARERYDSCSSLCGILF